MNKQLVMALLASGAMVGLSGCSEGDAVSYTHLTLPTNSGV